MHNKKTPLIQVKEGRRKRKVSLVRLAPFKRHNDKIKKELAGVIYCREMYNNVA